MEGVSVVPMNNLDKTLETDYFGSEGVHLQSSQVDHGHGVGKPGGVEQVSFPSSLNLVRRTLTSDV